MTVVYRDGKPEDAFAVNALFTEMLETIHGEKPDHGYGPHELDRFFDGGENRIFIAEENKEVIAYLAVEVHREKPPYLYLEDFSVTERCRSHGIGSTLLKQAVAYAQMQGIERIYLHVEKNNTQAQRFYSRHGYQLAEEQGHRLLMCRMGGNHR